MFIALAATLLPAYRFPNGTSVTYSVLETFKGYLPLLGGQNGVAIVNLSVRVKAGQATNSELPIDSKLTAFKVSFNGFTLPITIHDATRFFPATVFRITPTGAVLSSNAPQIKVPIRLPGLDIHRIPEMTFLPVEFPAQGVEIGRAFTFEKSYGDSLVSYRVRPTHLSGHSLSINIATFQEYKTFEDEASELVTDRKDAISEVVTTDTGVGKASFDLESGRFTSFTTTNTALSTVTSLSGGTVKLRKLLRHLNISANVTVNLSKIKSH